MTLSEFYTNETFYRTIDGIRISRDFVKTENGEIYKEDNELYYRANTDVLPVRLCSDVGEWLYLSDDKIVCAYVDDKEVCPTVRIVDVRGTQLASGALTSHGPVYERAAEIVKEDALQNETVIFTLPDDKQLITFHEDTFAITACYPHSDIFYHKHYDYNGEYCLQRTKADLTLFFMRDLCSAFFRWHVWFDAVRKDALTEQQRRVLKELDDIRFHASDVTFELIDRIISLAEETGIAQKHAVIGYQRIKALFLEHGITEHLLFPCLHIMAISRSGEFGARTSKWITITNAKRIEKIAKKTKDEFKNIVFDIDLLWKNMKALK